MSIPVTQMQSAQATPQTDDDDAKKDLDDVNVPAPPANVTQQELMNMSDDELHDFIIGVMKTDMPDFMPDGHFQHMVYAMGLNDKPEVVSESELRDMVKKGATTVYRTVNDTVLPGSVTMTSKQMAEDFADSDLFVTGGNGQRAYGDGLYFSDSHSGSRGGYGGSSAYTIGGVLNSNARIVSGTALRREYDSFIKTHPRTRRALGFASQRGNGGQRVTSLSQFALIRGYNVIVNDVWGGEHYIVVLDRSAVTTAKHNYVRPI